MLLALESVTFMSWPIFNIHDLLQLFMFVLLNNSQSINQSINQSIIMVGWKMAVYSPRHWLTSHSRTASGSWNPENMWKGIMSLQYRDLITPTQNFMAAVQRIPTRNSSAHILRSPLLWTSALFLVGTNDACYSHIHGNTFETLPTFILSGYT